MLCNGCHLIFLINLFSNSSQFVVGRALIIAEGLFSAEFDFLIFFLPAHKVNGTAVKRKIVVQSQRSFSQLTLPFCKQPNAVLIGNVLVSISLRFGVWMENIGSRSRCLACRRTQRESKSDRVHAMSLATIARFAVYGNIAKHIQVMYGSRDWWRNVSTPPITRKFRNFKAVNASFTKRKLFP